MCSDLQIKPVLLLRDEESLQISGVNIYIYICLVKFVAKLEKKKNLLIPPHLISHSSFQEEHRQTTYLNS